MVADTQIQDKQTDKELVIRQYGLLDPIDWDRDCDQELAKMDIFWNILVDINEIYYSRYYDLILSDKNLCEAKAIFDALSANSPNSKEAKEAKRNLGILQTEVQKRASEPLRTLEAQRREEVKIARQQSGLWWGNYNAVIRAFETARRTALRAGNRVGRRTRSDSSRFTNQLIGGAPVQRIFDGSLSQIYVRSPASGAWEGGTRGDRRRLQRTTLTATIFVREGERRNVTWPMVMHRPIPQDCIVKEVVVTRRMIAGKVKWFATFVCSRPTDQPIITRNISEPTAIDVGWRIIPEGLRVATVLHPHTEPYFIVLDRKLIASFALVNDLRTKLDHSASEGISIFEKHIPGILTDELKSRIRSSRTDLLDKHKVFAELLSCSNHEVRKTEHYISIIAWRAKHRRIAHWLINQQRKVISRRNHLYQNVSADISRSASSILINDLNLGRMVRNRSKEGAGTFFPQQARYYQNIAAISELTRWIGIQCNKVGVPVAKRQLRAPLPCPQCGATARMTRADALVQNCVACGASWDQDVAACRLLLSS